MGDTSNHYIGKSDGLRDDSSEELLEGRLRYLGAFLLAVVICAVLTVCCGCSRKVSENVEVHTTEQNCENGEVERTVNVVEQSASVTKTDGSIAGVLTRWVDDSLDVTLKVTEYGDDGQPKKVTEATLHRGKRDLASGVVKRDCHTEQVENAKRIETEDSRVSMSLRHDETEDVKRVVERKGWWSMHWRFVLCVVAVVMMVALSVWKRRRWVEIVVLWIRRFF